MYGECTNKMKITLEPQTLDQKIRETLNIPFRLNNLSKAYNVDLGLVEQAYKQFEKENLDILRNKGFHTSIFHVEVAELQAVKQTTQHIKTKYTKDYQ